MIHTDLGDPLTALRSKLEKKFNVNLSSFSIWLQVLCKLNQTIEGIHLSAI